jgi:hypothetical protein
MPLQIYAKAIASSQSHKNRPYYLLKVAGRRWSLGIAVDLGGSQVTIVTGKIFKSAPNVRMEKAKESNCPTVQPSNCPKV